MLICFVYKIIFLQTANAREGAERGDQLNHLERNLCETATISSSSNQSFLRKAKYS